MFSFLFFSDIYMKIKGGIGIKGYSRYLVTQRVGGARFQVIQRSSVLSFKYVKCGCYVFCFSVISTRKPLAEFAPKDTADTRQLNG